MLRHHTIAPFIPAPHFSLVQAMEPQRKSTLVRATAQFVLILPLEAGLSIERRANICLSTRHCIAVAENSGSMICTVFVIRLTGLQSYAPNSALIRVRRPLIGGL